MAEKSFTEKDMQYTFELATKLWFEKRAVLLFLFFIFGLMVGFVFGFSVKGWGL